MNKILLNFLTFQLFSLTCAQILSDPFREYLNERLHFFSDKLKRSNINDNFQSGFDFEQKDIYVQFDSMKYELLDTNFLSVHTFTLFNETYVLLDLELYKIYPAQNNLSLNMHSRFPLGIEHKILLVKTVQFLDFGILLISFENGHSYVYAYIRAQDTWLYMQTIENVGQPRDACFFINKGNLHLTIVNNNHNALVPTIVYKWLGSYFDETATVLTTYGRSVLSFSNEQSEIIVILRNSEQIGKEVPSLVLEFNADSLKKLHYLDTDYPTIATTYKFNEEIYLVVFDTFKFGKLFWWDGSQFFPHSAIDNSKAIEKLVLAHVAVEKVPILFAINSHILYAYRYIDGKFQIIADIRLNKIYKNILDLQIIHLENKHILAVFGLTENDQLDFAYFQFFVKIRNKEDLTPKKNSLLQCFNSLYERANERRKNIDQAFEISKILIQINEPTYIKGRLNIASGIFINTANLSSEYLTNKYQKDVLNLSQKLDNIMEKVQGIKTVSKRWTNSTQNSSLRLTGKIIVNGFFQVRELEAENVTVQNVNDVVWEPNNWLSYSKPQKLKVLLAPTIKSDNLKLINANKTILKDVLLLKKDNQIISQTENIENLHADNIDTSSINGIKVSDIYFRSDNGTIFGAKVVPNLVANNMNVTFFNGMKTKHYLNELHSVNEVTKVTFPQNLKVKNFNFRNIDGVNWENFYNSIFKVGIDRVITGNIFIKTMESKYLNANTFGGILVNDLFTTDTDQNVTSSIKFQNIQVENLTCQIINGLNFKEDVVNSKTNVVYGPVTIKKVHVKNNLFMNTTDDKDALKFSDNRVIGTNESDLMQMYNKSVKIKGNLFLKNVKFLSDTKVVYNTDKNESKVFNLEELDQYWMKDILQVIPVKVNLKDGTTIEHLHTKFINNISMDSIYLNDLQDKPKIDVIFKNVSVFGNITLNQNLAQDSPNLRDMRANCVKLNNGSYKIQGVKSFLNNLTVGNLNVNIINKDKVNNLANSKTYNNIIGKKMFSKIVFENTVNVANLINSSYVNNLYVSNFTESIVFVDKDATLSNANFEQIKARNVFPKYVNGIAVDEMERQETTKSVLEKLTVNGNLRINKVDSLLKLNNVSDFNNFLENVILPSDKSLNIKGNISLAGNIAIGNLETVTINNMNIVDIFENILHKSKPQNISGRYIFNRLATPFVQANSINSNDRLDLLKKTSIFEEFYSGEFFVFKEDVILENAQFSSINANLFKCNIRAVEKALLYPPTRAWASIQVINDIHFMDEECDMAIILNNAVCTNKNNTITAPVIFKNTVSIYNFWTRHLINGVDLMEIFNDAVLKSGNEQYQVRGFKSFHTLRANSASVFGGISVGTVNSVNVSYMNENLVRKRQLETKTPIFIQGVKTFKGQAIISHLQSISLFEMNPDVFVTYTRPKVIPKATFKHLEILENLWIVLVNGINMTDIINERLLLNFPTAQYANGLYYFDFFSLMGPTEISAINKLPVSDVVFDVGTQTITGTKKFAKNVFKNGNIYIQFLNDILLDRVFFQAIMRNEDLRFDGHVIFQNTTYFGSNLYTEKINGVPITTIENILISKENNRNEIGFAEGIAKQLNLEIEGDAFFVEGLKSWETYLYLEKIPLAQTEMFSIPNSIGAVVSSFPDYFLLSIYSLVPGDTCGLQPNCSCTVQSALFLYENSVVNPFFKENVVRTFSYTDELISITVQTHSVSTGPECLSEYPEDEITQVLWTADHKNSSVFQNIRGYVKEVNFFTMGKFTFAIVCPFYDPVIDSFHLECLVLRFSENMDEVEVIQKIPTYGAWTSKILHTVQGTVLIVGHVYNNFSVPQNLQILKFNEVKMEFEFMTFVPSSSCMALDGITIGEDSLIVVAQSGGPLLILKYDRYIKNYKLFQTINLDNKAIDVSIFNTGDANHVQPFLCVATETGEILLYSYQNIQGWKLESYSEVPGVRMVVPYNLGETFYLFVVSVVQNQLLIVIKQGRS